MSIRISLIQLSPPCDRFLTLAVHRFRSLNGSLICNPWDAFAVSDAIHEALTMPTNVRRENFEKLSRYVHKHTASWWGLSFVNE